MKHFYTLLALTLSFFSITGAQNPIVVSEEELTLGDSNVNGYTVTIPEVSYEQTLKNWIKYLESGTRSKVVQKGNNLSIFGAKVKPLSENPVNVYSIVTNDNSGVKIQTAMEMERDNYAGSTEYANARKYIFDFAKDQYVAVVNDQLKEEERKLRDLNSDLKSLENDQGKMERSTASARETIEEERQRLADLNSSLAALSPQQYQGGDSAQFTGMGAASPEAVKDLEKERKKINRDIRSTENSIEKAERDIRESERELPGNLSKQEDARRLVDEQEEVVEFHRQKLETIKAYQ
jgi:prefoldin subunit 5